MTDAVFVADGNLLVPQPRSRAGWYDDALAGGPVAAAFGRAVEAVETPAPMTVTRLTIDLLRPVPMRPLTITTSVSREGRKIQVLGAVMEADGTAVATASALRIRTTDLAVPEHPRRASVPPPTGLPAFAFAEDRGEQYHSHAVEVRFAEGAWEEPGPATVWVRLLVPLVAGEATTPLQRLLALSDFGNGLSRVLPWDWIFINADLTVHVRRIPRGEWVCLRSRTDLGDDGTGLAQSELFDEQGDLGHALQSLLIDRL